MTQTIAPFEVHCPSCSTSFPVAPDRVPDDGVHAVCSACMRTFLVELSEELRDLRAGPNAGGFSGAAQPDLSVPASARGVAALPDVDPVIEEEIDLRPSESELDDGIDFELVSPPSAGVPEDVEILAYEQVEVIEEPKVDEVADLIGSDVEPEEGVEALQPAPPREPPPPDPGIENLSSLTDEVLAEEPTGDARRPTLSEGASRFGRRDPHERARRLARVLVSDIIAYYPEKHAEAVRRGTVREEFEDEVSKSWKEFVDQVGSELAEDTPYFREALNEVLARGQQVY